MFCILPAWPPTLDIYCPTNCKLIFQTRSKNVRVQVSPAPEHAFFTARQSRNQKNFEQEETEETEKRKSFAKNAQFSGIALQRRISRSGNLKYLWLV
jgi:hypothetical protein